MMKGLPLAYNKDLQEDKEPLFDTVATVKACLEAMTILVAEGITFQPQRLAAAVASDFSNATDVADYLAAKGVPFREAYNLVGQVVRASLAAGKLLKDLSLAEWQALHPAFEADIYRDRPPAGGGRPQQSGGHRIRSGATGPRYGPGNSCDGG
jgi:argininosuccinate lyase